MAFRFRDRLACGSIPYTRRLVKARPYHVLAVGREGRTRNAPGMAFQPRELSGGYMAGTPNM